MRTRRARDGARARRRRRRRRRPGARGLRRRACAAACNRSCSARRAATASSRTCSQPEAGALAAELAARRPVLVLQNLGLDRVPVWHYAVVVGLDGDDVILRSGTEQRRIERSSRFLRSWQRGSNWAFVAVEPGELPATATPGAYVRALAGAEPLLDAAAAERGYGAALERWPSDELVLFAAAGQRHGAGDLEGATALYRRLLGAAPQHAAARNNLANVLAAARLPHAGARRSARGARRARARATSSPPPCATPSPSSSAPPRRVRGRRRAASDASAMTAGKTEAQTAGAVLMIRPAHFGSNAETAGSNFFQRSAAGIARRRAARTARVRRAGARARRRRRARASVRRSTRRGAARRGFSEQLAELARRRHGRALPDAGAEPPPRAAAATCSTRSSTRAAIASTASSISRRSKPAASISKAPAASCSIARGAWPTRASRRARTPMRSPSSRARSATRSCRSRPSTPPAGRSITRTSCCRSARASPRSARARSPTPRSAARVVARLEALEPRAHRSRGRGARELRGQSAGARGQRGAGHRVIGCGAALAGRADAARARAPRRARAGGHRDDRAHRRRQRALHARRGGVAACGLVRRRLTKHAAPDLLVVERGRVHEHRVEVRAAVARDLVEHLERRRPLGVPDLPKSGRACSMLATNIGSASACAACMRPASRVPLTIMIWLPPGPGNVEMKA